MNLKYTLPFSEYFTQSLLISDVWREFTNYEFSITEEVIIPTSIVNEDDTNVVCIIPESTWSKGIVP